MKKVKFDIDETDSLQGVKVISLVDEPAIESNFVFFKKEKSKAFIELKGEKYKQIVAGLALIPDKEILRYTKDDQPFVGYFTKEAIEKIRDKFSKERLTDRVNVDHSSDNYIDAYLLDNYIIESEQQLEHVKNLGIDQAVIGSWFVSYKIEDKEIFEKVVSGELNGFSVEIFLQQFLKVENNISGFKNNMLKKLQDLVQKLQAELSAVSKENFERAKDSEGQTIEYSEVGEAVNIVSVADDESESSEPAPDGDYKLDNGKTVVVASGVATEIKDTESEPEEQKKVEKQEKLNSVYASYTLEDGSQVDVQIISVNQASQYTDEGYKVLESGTYKLMDGGELVVGEKGEVISAPVISEPEQIDEEFKRKLEESKKLEKELTKQVEELKSQVEKLKKEPITKPAKVEKKKVIEMTSLSNADKFRAKHGILN